MSHVIRKPVNGICEQQRCRSACASAQSDQRLCCSLPWWYNRSSFYIRNFKPLLSSWSWAGRFESSLLATPKTCFLVTRFISEWEQENSNTAMQKFRSSWASNLWSESLLSTYKRFWSLASQTAYCKDSNQTRWMPRLIWVFAGGIGHFVVFVMLRLIT